ncbi:histone deacetylase [Plantactinospora sp. CA-290183]|uniref:histone deacetylase n=1 Tax=Plantactinospora sp. CA-290183 TaxID=3240006 RepID=UPI003D8A0BAC
MDLRHIWYVAYGTNLCAGRLGCYLGGGSPPGALRGYPGCRDRRPPRASAPVMLTGGIYFALESRAWTGGMAFYDPELPGEAAARAYLLGAGQFADVAAQEMYRPPGTDLDLAELVRRGRTRLGPGRYETVLRVGELDGYPMLTFTAPWRAYEVRWNRPAPAYLGMLAAGLRESHGWDAARIADYLRVRPGVAGRWRPAQLRRIAASAAGAQPGQPVRPGPT